MIEKIVKVLNEDIRPILNRDGGDVEIVDYVEEEGLLRLRLRGQCSTCPLSQHTVDSVIKRILREKASIEHVAIEAGLSEEMLALAKEILNGGGKC